MSSPDNPVVYLCIPVHNRRELTLRCLATIASQTYPYHRVIICDDGSTDGTAEAVRQAYPHVLLEKGDGNLWWAGATNHCVQRALQLCSPGDYIYTLNNDTELFPDTLEKLIKTASNHPGAVVATLNLFHSDHGQIENSTFIEHGWRRGLRRLHQWGQAAAGMHGTVEVHGLAGKGILIPSGVFHRTGLYNEKALPHYHADLEFSIRARRLGLRLLLSLDARLLSHQHLSGTGSLMSVPRIGEFMRSFTHVKSTHHLPSLWNLQRLTNGSLWFLHFLKDLVFINLGFFKRYFTYHFRRNSQ